jgi:hypothetical protein
VSARPEGVNRPDLLPKGSLTPVIDVAGFLTPSEVSVSVTSIALKEMLSLKSLHVIDLLRLKNDCIGIILMKNADIFP